MYSRSRIALIASLMLSCATPTVWAQSKEDGEPKPQTTDASPSGDSVELPEALKGTVEETLPRVLGPVRLREDPRAKIPAQPTDIEEILSRFFPTWHWARAPQELTLIPDDPSLRVEWKPEAGACYAALAFDHTLADFEARQRDAGGKLAWWEAGADLDIQVRDAATGGLIAEDLSRGLIPKVHWCSDGQPVVLDVRLGVPADAPRSVDVSWGIAVDASTLPPLRFSRDDGLTQRLQWAQSVVTPRGQAQSAPAVFEVNGATLIHAHVRPPEEGCDVLIAIGEAGVKDLALAQDDSTMLHNDFALFPLAAVPICADEQNVNSTQKVVVGVREGQGRVALQRFGFSR